MPHAGLEQSDDMLELLEGIQLGRLPWRKSPITVFREKLI
jgi:hypothetical protein